MKKLLLILALVLIFTNISKADQLAWLTKDDLKLAVEYLDNNDIEEVILFCGCCDNDPKTKINVSKIYYRRVKESKEYYEIVIKGTAPGNKPIKQAVDLAYVHIEKKGKAVCLGLEMGFKCDPCVKPFDWF